MLVVIGYSHGINAVLRVQVTVLKLGWAVVQIVADNAGYWACAYLPSFILYVLTLLPPASQIIPHPHNHCVLLKSSYPLYPNFTLP